LRGDVLHAAQLMWLATEGSAATLHKSGQIGHLGTGAMADITVLDLAATPLIAQRVNSAENVWDQLFPTIMMGDDRSIKDVWVAGSRVT
ncbi:MAG: guanine deaminase, partial [Yoonia sp.]